MKEQRTPKGVWWSTAVMSFPLFGSVGYLMMMSPMAANAALVDPNTFSYVARSCLRLLSLNLSFLGGIHYGFSSAAYDIARSEEEKRRVSLQMFYSFVPAIVSFTSTNFLLFSAHLTIPTVIFGFTSLMLT